jgi:hypothetical protein
MNEFIVNEIIKQQKWKDNMFLYEFYPLDNHSKIKFRHVRLKILRIMKQYTGTLSVEIMSYCIKTVQETERYNKKKSDNIYFDFQIKTQPTFKKCIEQLIKTLQTIDTCQSCNRIYRLENLDENKVCFTCHLQNMFEIKKDQCCICLDTDCVKLFHALPCKHEFHFSCLSKLEKKECPLCRDCFTLR